MWLCPFLKSLSRPVVCRSRSDNTGATLTVTKALRNPCDASHHARSALGSPLGRWLGRTQNRIGQLAEAEAGEPAAEQRALDAQLSGGVAAGLTPGSGKRLGACWDVVCGSLSHAGPWKQGWALPVGSTRTRYNFDAAMTSPATMLTIRLRSGYLSLYLIHCYHLMPGPAPAGPPCPASLLRPYRVDASFHHGPAMVNVARQHPKCCTASATPARGGLDGILQAMVGHDLAISCPRCTSSAVAHLSIPSAVPQFRLAQWQIVRRLPTRHWS